MTRHDLLAAENVTFRRGPRRILQSVDLSLRAGELAVLIGPNGAGKSTLLHLLAGDLAANHGRITFAGRDIRAWRPRELARRRAVMSQSMQLAFPFTVGEVAEMALDHADGGWRRRIVAEMLSLLGISGLTDRVMQQLSGGEQQRVHLARVLCQLMGGAGQGAQFLFLDEPVSSLDIRHQIQVLEVVRARVSARLGALVILHDLNLAAAFADRLIIMDGGVIAADGPPRQVLTPDLLSTIYGIGLDVAELATGLHVTPRRTERKPTAVN